MTVPVSEKGTPLSFHYGDEKISFTRVPRPCTANAVLIKVHPSTKVVVAAPESATDDVVIEATKKRQRWIYKKLHEFREQQQYVIPRSYISGESHYYLGKQYQLKVMTSRQDKQSVKLLRGKIEATVQRKNADTVRKTLAEWYRERANHIFHTRLNAVMDQVMWATELPPLQIRTMKTQWGSCSPKGRILLNLHLVKAPRDCIDYVILHELCHLAEHNHSDRFYRLMKQVMPNWENTKHRLDGLAVRLLL